METKFEPVILKKYGGDWLPLASPTSDLGLAKSIAMAPIINGDKCIACGVMDLSPMSDEEKVIDCRIGGMYYVYEVNSMGWGFQDGNTMERYYKSNSQQKIAV
ncbi:hypothetical protein LCGC14_0390650 [marine sediment metagenome]|uniref:Uncharacterized protein n=1 Tax=marine sediment metagenome TaxID=412755 RepID=A0A0F9SZV6_9ZZZZ